MKNFDLTLTEAELVVVDELVEREFMRCMWALDRKELKYYMKILDKLGIKLTEKLSNSKSKL